MRCKEVREGAKVTLKLHEEVWVNGKLVESFDIELCKDCAVWW